ncbi:ferric reductase NAD binding domain-containing protein [Mariannaea sp. PMI_226]|nr:ferric reductase NAD binding domain-containing protein [Mariannaea sp. PMI_226]
MDPSITAKLARRSELNHEAMVVFAVAVSALVGLVLLFHLTWPLGARQTKFARGLAPAIFVALKIRSILLAKFPGLPSVGHLFIVMPFLGINFIVAFIKFDNNNMPLLSNVASRTGWMTIANTFVVIFLSLKNTPLAILTLWSYERINIFHRLAGYTAISFLIIHACSYAMVFGNLHLLSRLTEPCDLFGTIAGFCFLLVGIAGAVIRRWWYELFYYLHIGLWMLGIIMVGLHQPEPSKKVIFVTCTVAGVWILDRLIRLCRVVVNGTNNAVTLFPLSHGGTRLLFTKSPAGVLLGNHVLVWIPAIRAFQTHPFTIVATEPLELVVSAKNGFTRYLHDYALQYPGASLNCALDGPYGKYPNIEKYDKTVLVAGGSGASFTIGATMKLLTGIRDERKSIVFIWIMSHQSFLTWFVDHLNIMRNDNRLSIQIYVTQQLDVRILDSKDTLSSESSLQSNEIGNFEKPEVFRSIAPTSQPETDLEKKMLHSPIDPPVSPSGTMEAPSEFPIMYNKPDVSKLIKSEIDSMTPKMSVLIMSCGPQSLTAAVRNATAENIRADGPMVGLYCEQFGW